MPSRGRETGNHSPAVRAHRGDAESPQAAVPERCAHRHHHRQPARNRHILIRVEDASGASAFPPLRLNLLVSDRRRGRSGTIQRVACEDVRPREQSPAAWSTLITQVLVYEAIPAWLTPQQAIALYGPDENRAHTRRAALGTGRDEPGAAPAGGVAARPLRHAGGGAISCLLDAGIVSSLGGAGIPVGLEAEAGGRGRRDR